MKVNTQRLEEQAGLLRGLSHSVSGIQDSVLRTVRSLSRESIGEEFRIPILALAASVENRAEELMRMGRVLQDIARIYERSEQEVLDEADHANIHHPHFGTGAIPIPDFPRFILNPGDISGAGTQNGGTDASGDDWSGWDIAGWDTVLRQFRTPEPDDTAGTPGSTDGIPAEPMGGIDWTPWDP